MKFSVDGFTISTNQVEVRIVCNSLEFYLMEGAKSGKYDNLKDFVVAEQLSLNLLHTYCEMNFNMTPYSNIMTYEGWANASNAD